MAAHQGVPVLPDLNINAFITGVNNIFVRCTIFLTIFPGVVWPVGVMLHIIKMKRLKALAAPLVERCITR
jgi:hypothetical protein